MAPPINMSFESVSRTGSVAMAFGVSVSLPIGRYAFHAVMDSQLLASAPLDIIKQGPPAAGRKPKRGPKA